MWNEVWVKVTVSVRVRVRIRLGFNSVASVVTVNGTETAMFCCDRASCHDSVLGLKWHSLIFHITQ